MDERDMLRTAIAGAVGAVRRGDEDDALVRFGRLAGRSGLMLRESVLELAGANVQMLFSLAGREPDETLLFTLTDEEHDTETTIDEAEPAQRASARVLLALANGHQEDAEAQLDIVASAGDPDETGHVFAHTMSWTLELLDACVDTGQPVPPWLRPVLTGG
jgi:hypothetical protein